MLLENDLLRNRENKDHHHLNDKGAEMFSRQIAADVVAPAFRNWQGFKDAIKAKKGRITER